MNISKDTIYTMDKKYLIETLKTKQFYRYLVETLNPVYTFKEKWASEYPMLNDHFTDNE